ncbi:hypothetical protein PHYBOEH_004521 [Phytophthora boehmeriae]|uniref:BEACH domain-containing protein n=1 Tax=Phytophthora boehmeriae TaxID=109152 RepID=A0A8T1WRA0_9STRA|nr:hypothetical protein PHYBOEH_004521 [Phytophthora boehmeriae]
MELLEPQDVVSVFLRELLGGKEYSETEATRLQIRRPSRLKILFTGIVGVVEEAEQIRALEALISLVRSSCGNVEACSTGGLQRDILGFLSERGLFADPSLPHTVLKKLLRLFLYLAYHSVSIDDIQAMLAVFRSMRMVHEEPDDQAVSYYLSTLEMIARDSFGPASFFDLNGEYSGLMLPVLPAFPNNGYTFCAWIKFEFLPEEVAPLFTFCGKTGVGVTCSFLRSSLMITSFDKRKNDGHVEVPDLVTPGRWHFLCITHTHRQFRGSKLDIYLNSELRQSVRLAYPNTALMAPVVKAYLAMRESNGTNSLRILLGPTSLFGQALPANIINNIRSVDEYDALVFQFNSYISSSSTSSATGVNGAPGAPGGSNNATNSTDGLLLAYDARHCDRLKGLCYDSSGNDYHAAAASAGVRLRHAGTFKQAVAQLGGPLVCLPLLVTSTTAAVSTVNAVASNPNGGGNSEVTVAVKMGLAGNTGNSTTQFDEDSDFLKQMSDLIARPMGVHSIPKVVLLIAEIMRHSLVNKFIFRRSQGVRLMALLVRSLPPQYLTAELLLAIERLRSAVISDRILADEIYKFLLFNFRVWVNAPVDLQTTVFDKLEIMTRKDSSNLSPASTRHFLRCLSWIYWRVPTSTTLRRAREFTPEEIDLLRKRVMAMIKIVLCESPPPKSAGSVMAFSAKGKDVKSQLSYESTRSLIFCMIGKSSNPMIPGMNVDGTPAIQEIGPSNSSSSSATVSSSGSKSMPESDLDGSGSAVENVPETDLPDLLQLLIELSVQPTAPAGLLDLFGRLGGLRIWLPLLEFSNDVIRVMTLRLLRTYLFLKCECTQDRDKVNSPDKVQLSVGDAYLIMHSLKPEERPVSMGVYSEILLMILGIQVTEKDMKALDGKTAAYDALIDENVLSTAMIWHGNMMSAFMGLLRASSVTIRMIAIRHLKIIFASSTVASAVNRHVLIFGSISSMGGTATESSTTEQVPIIEAILSLRGDPQRHHEQPPSPPSSLFGIELVGCPGVPMSRLRDLVLNTQEPDEVRVNALYSIITHDDVDFVRGLLALHGDGDRKKQGVSASCFNGMSSRMKLALVELMSVFQPSGCVDFITLMSYDVISSIICLEVKTNEIAWFLLQDPFTTLSRFITSADELEVIVVSLLKTTLDKMNEMLSSEMNLRVNEGTPSRESILWRNAESLASLAAAVVLHYDPDTLGRVDPSTLVSGSRDDEDANNSVFWKSVKLASILASLVSVPLRSSDELATLLVRSDFYTNNQEVRRRDCFYHEQMAHARDVRAMRRAGMFADEADEKDRAKAELQRIGKFTRSASSLGAPSADDEEHVWLERVKAKDIDDWMKLRVLAKWGVRHVWGVREEAVVSSVGDGNIIGLWGDNEFWRVDIYTSSNWIRCRLLPDTDDTISHNYSANFTSTSLKHEMLDNMTDDMSMPQVGSIVVDDASSDPAEQTLEDDDEDDDETHGIDSGGDGEEPEGDEDDVYVGLARRISDVGYLDDDSNSPTQLGASSGSEGGLARSMLRDRMHSSDSVGEVVDATSHMETLDQIQELHSTAPLAPPPPTELGNDGSDDSGSPATSVNDNVARDRRVSVDVATTVKSAKGRFGTISTRFSSGIKLLAGGRPASSSSAGPESSGSHRSLSGVSEEGDNDPDSQDVSASETTATEDDRASPSNMTTDASSAEPNSSGPTASSLMLKKFPSKHEHWKTLSAPYRTKAYLVLPSGVLVHGVLRIGLATIVFEGERVVTLRGIAEAFKPKDDGGFVARQRSAQRIHEAYISQLKRRVWGVRVIRVIHRRRFLMEAQNGLEIYFVDGSSCLFGFESNGEADLVYATLKERKPPCLAKWGKRLLTTERMFSKSKWTEMWVRREISNFEYLMALNASAGRSYNDIAQYPVFPWVIKDFESAELRLDDPEIYRDLRRPIGAQTPEMIQRARASYDGWDPKAPIPAFHYANMYSHMQSVLYFLVRLAPFTGAVLGSEERQHLMAAGNEPTFDSIPEAFRMCTSDERHLFELTPEFFYLPELFSSDRNKTLARHFAPGEDVSTTAGLSRNVTLPPWAASPYDFVRLHRLALESDFVSSNLHHWIDLIFGCKQSGSAAVDALNSYHIACYPERLDLSTSSDGVRAKLVQRGTVPIQLFRKPHPARMTQDESLEARYPASHSMAVLSSRRQGDTLVHSITTRTPQRSGRYSRANSLFSDDKARLTVGETGGNHSSMVAGNLSSSGYVVTGDQQLEQQREGLDQQSELYVVSINGHVVSHDRLVSGVVKSEGEELTQGEDDKPSTPHLLLERGVLFTRSGEYLITACAGADAAIEVRDAGMPASVVRRIECKRAGTELTSLSMGQDERCIVCGYADGAVVAYALHFGVADGCKSLVGLDKQARERERAALAQATKRDLLRNKRREELLPAFMRGNGGAEEGSLWARQGKSAMPEEPYLTHMQERFTLLKQNCVSGDEKYEGMLRQLWNAIYSQKPFDNGSQSSTTEAPQPIAEGNLLDFGDEDQVKKQGENVASPEVAQELQFERVGESWSRLGFQRPDPTTDFRAGGMLSLDCLVYFASHYTSQAVRMVTSQVPGSHDNTYPWGPAGINVTCMVARIFWKFDGEVVRERQTNWPLFYDSEAFHLLFSEVFVLFDYLWNEMNANYGSFSMVIQATSNRIMDVLEEAKGDINVVLVELRSQSLASVGKQRRASSRSMEDFLTTINSNITDATSAMNESLANPDGSTSTPPKGSPRSSWSFTSQVSQSMNRLSLGAIGSPGSATTGNATATTTDATTTTDALLPGIGDTNSPRPAPIVTSNDLVPGVDDPFAGNDIRGFEAKPPSPPTVQSDDPFACLM